MQTLIELTSSQKAVISETAALHILKGATFSGGKPHTTGQPYDLLWRGKRVEVRMSTAYPAWHFSTYATEDSDLHLFLGYHGAKLLRAFLVPSHELVRFGGYSVVHQPTAKRSRSKLLPYEVDVRTGDYL